LKKFQTFVIFIELGLKRFIPTYESCSKFGKDHTHLFFIFFFYLFWFDWGRFSRDQSNEKTRPNKMNKKEINYI